MTIKLLFAWYDLWIGFYYDRKNKSLYIFPIPMVGIVIKPKIENTPERKPVFCPINTMLLTKDGRKTGNGIVVEVNNNLYTIITDYGNKMRIDGNVIRELFYIDNEIYSPEEMELRRNLPPHKHSVSTPKSKY